ncbi:integrase core domain [Plakobranchus ocellatus]|uniref:Integrase core domain n=1 Tax=Plakobranchus ocellatus TaxID=259542 RepID=A0AAV4DKI1_9GAST|nr:integrase core domain [Plakobranchus ocellatus]
MVMKAYSRRDRLEKIPPMINKSLKRMAIDIVGPVNPLNEAGHGFILTLMDFVIRYTEVVPVRKIDAGTVAETLVDTYNRLSVSHEVLSDQGTQAVSHCTREVYHSNFNGPVEN